MRLYETHLESIGQKDILPITASIRPFLQTEVEVFILVLKVALAS